VLVLHGGGLPAFAERHPARVRACLERATLVAAPSQYLICEMRRYREDIRLVANAIEIDDYRYIPRKQPEPRLVWLRKFARMYNPTMAAEVLHQISPEFPNAQLIMVGRDSGDGSLQETIAAARRLGVEGRLKTVPGVPKEKVSDWLNQGDIFLNTTDIDNTPVSLIEAMACGLCVVSTDVGGTGYLVDHERDGLLVPPRDAGAMSAAVRRLLTERGLAASLSANGRRKAETFDWPPIVGAWDELLRSLSGRCV
jgi:glycosyltransferase involved in cell wall biosynthesis